MTELTHYDAAKRELAIAHEVDEVAELRNKAACLETYARQAKDTHLESQACEIRLRAERKVGALLAEKERATPKGSGSNQHQSRTVQREPSSYAEAKAKAGVSDTQAKRWQKLAKVSEEDFEAALASPEQKPTTSGIIKKRNNSISKMNPHALWLWGRLRDFEREGIADIDPSEILGELTEAMAADVCRIAPLFTDYLRQIEELFND